MARPRYDIVIEAVRYRSDGLVDWVRAYERRGPIFSDRILISRDTLIDRLDSGERAFVGKRMPRLGGQFEVFDQVRILWFEDRRVLVAGEGADGQDHLEGAPLI